MMQNDVEGLSMANHVDDVLTRSDGLKAVKIKHLNPIGNYYVGG
jgi:hypothetical protein